jgi:hypothetical protein
MSALPALPPQELSSSRYLELPRRPTVQTIDERNGGYDSESDTSLHQMNRNKTPGWFLESPENNYDRSSRSRGNRSSRHRDHAHEHRSVHAPSSAAHPPTSAMSQYTSYDGQTVSYMEPSGGQIRPYYNPVAAYDTIHAPHVIANGGPSYQGYHPPNSGFVNPGHPMNPHPVPPNYSNIYGASHPHPAGAYYASDHQHHHLHTGNVYPPDSDGYMRTRESSHTLPPESKYGSSMHSISEAERMRREFQAFKMSPADRRHSARGKDKEREIENEKAEKKDIKREKRARAKQKKNDKKSEDMKEIIALLTQQMAEVQATMYQEKQKKETKDREMLSESKKAALENRLRDFGYMLAPQKSVQFEQQQEDSRKAQGPDQMLQKIVGIMEQLLGEQNSKPRNDLERLALKDGFARRSSIGTDHSESVNQWVSDEKMRRQVEEMVVDFLRKVYSEDSYGNIPPPLALQQGSTASDYNRGGIFNVSDHQAGGSKVGSQSSRTVVNNNNPIDGDLSSPKLSQLHTSLRPQKNARKKSKQNSKSRKINPPQKPLSKNKRNRSRQPSDSEDTEESDGGSSYDELDESDENTDENTDDDDDYDDSSSEVEKPRRDARGKKIQSQKPKREAKIPRKATTSKTKPKEQRGKHRDRGHAAYVEDEMEEDLEEWKRQKLSRYAIVPPPAPNPPNLEDPVNEILRQKILHNEHYQKSR